MAETKKKAPAKRAAPKKEPEPPKLPERSEVLPGGGVSRGAIVHVALPDFLAPPQQPLSEPEAAQLAGSREGDAVLFAGPRALRLADARRFVVAEEVEVLGFDGATVSLRVIR